jgi:hypothetical protein
MTELKILSKKSIAEVFSNVEKLYQNSMRFKEALKTRIEEHKATSWQPINCTDLVLQMVSISCL